MKISIKALLIAAFVPALAGCYEDKGNYTYGEVEEITVTFPEIMEAMQGMPIAFEPVIESSVNGVIKPDNPDYEYSCEVKYDYFDEEYHSYHWLDINPDKKQAIDFTYPLPAADYLVWYKVKNVKTDIEHNFRANFNVKSSTHEGWMVLCRDADSRARLDIMFKNAQQKDEVFANIIKDDKVRLYNPRQLVFMPKNRQTGDEIFIVSDDATYRLHIDNLNVLEGGNLMDFFLTSDYTSPVNCFEGVYNFGYEPDYELTVTAEGNVFALMSRTSGGTFEYPLNTDKIGNPPTYKVAPAIGHGFANSDLAVFYDVTNKKFKGTTWSGDNQTNMALYDLMEPEIPLFSYSTGLDFVDMTMSALGTGGQVFTILKEPGGHRVLYAIGVNGTERNDYTQKGYYPNITTPDFDSATDYAASSQYSYLYYCKGNKVYSISYPNNMVTDEITLPAGETATLVKFNRYQRLLMYKGIQRVPRDEEYRSMQNKLIVGSSDGTENGGVIRFYDISPEGKFTLYKEMKGFGAEIVDVIYREQKH